MSEDERERKRLQEEWEKIPHIQVGNAVDAEWHGRIRDTFSFARREEYKTPIGEELRDLQDYHLKHGWPATLQEMERRRERWECAARYRQERKTEHQEEDQTDAGGRSAKHSKLTLLETEPGMDCESEPRRCQEDGESHPEDWNRQESRQEEF